MIVVALICIVLSIGYILHVLSLNRKYKFAKHLPEHKPWYPIIGNGLVVVGKSEVDRFTNICKIFDSNDQICKIWFGPKLVFCVTHPDLVEKLLMHPDCTEKPFFYDFFKVESGLVSAKHKIWKPHRKALNSTFNLKILHSFIPIFINCSEKLVENLEMHASNGDFNIGLHTARCSLEMICGTSLGVDILEREGKTAFLETLDHLFLLVTHRMFNIHLYMEAIYRCTAHYFKDLKYRALLTNFCNKLIDEKRVALANSNNNDAVDEEYYKKPQIFIDQLLSTNAAIQFTNQEIEDHIFTMISAGNETSALTAAYAFLFLGMNPDVQEKAVAELKRVFHNKDVEITSESLRDLEYLEMIVKETLRLCPIAPLIARENMSEIDLGVCKAPKGNTFALNFYSLHRRKDIWGPNPEKFNPDHFSPENSKGRHPFAYLPFSGGARGCIGNRYAMISLKIMLALVLKNYKITTNMAMADLVYKMEISLKLTKDHTVQIEKREDFYA